MMIWKDVQRDRLLFTADQKDLGSSLYNENRNMLGLVTRSIWLTQVRKRNFSSSWKR
jgi:hypothetical protein